MRFIEVNCPVCQANDYKVLYPDTLGAKPPLFGYKWVPDIRKSYRTVKCNSCGHAYCSPRLEDMYQYYQDVVDEDYLKNEHLRTATAKEVLKTIKYFVPAGRLLDIGCSTGDFLAVAKEFYDVEGLELSTWASKVAIGRKLAIHKKKIEELADAKPLYDIVTLWGVIEHLEHPLPEMKQVNRLLKTGGIVCLWTGDVDSIYSRIFKQQWWYVLGQHIQLFSKKSLDRLLRDTGFECLQMGIYPYVISFEYLAISLSRYPFVGALAKWIFRMLNLENSTFALKKSDEMFAVYKKVRDLSR